jgi:hypothetical protein
MTDQLSGWLWLFPATYAVHIAEEGLAGQRFYRWIQRIPLARALGVQISGSSFLVVNVIYLAAMLAAVVVASSPDWGWLIPALGALIAVNGLGHLAGSLATGSYSPGLISGLILWLPLGAFALVASHGTLPQFTFWAGVGAGLLIQAAVAASVLLISLVEHRLRVRPR